MLLYTILARIFRRIVLSGDVETGAWRFYYRKEYEAYQAQRAACDRRLLP